MIALVLATVLTGGAWRAVPATGVEMKLTQAEGVRVDFDFHGHGGYAIARREGALELPENFELAFRMRADAPRNTLEVKFIEGDNVWWSVRRDLEFPREWRRFSVKKRQIEFAWGPGGPAPLPKRIDAIEIVVTAGTGGKGTVWLDDIDLAPLDTAPPGELPRITWSGNTMKFDRRYEIGGLVVDWARPPASYEIVIDGQVVQRTSDRWVYLPDTDASSIELRSDGGAIRDVRVLPPLASENEFYALMARDSPRGQWPRYLLGEQSYWTVIGGIDGEQVEYLFSEDGAIEAGSARFSIEPFLRIDGKLVTWNDVTIEQRSGPSVVWKKHLTITPVADGNTLRVRYQTAPNAQLLLKIRPLQVNTPWQFLKRTGGYVKIHAIKREGDTITVDADDRATITSSNFTFENDTLAFTAHDVTLVLDCGGKAAPFLRGSKAAALIDVPAKPEIRATLEAQLNYILINRDGPAIQPGSRSYERSWIRDGALTSAALLRLGRDDVVRQFLEWYAGYVAPNGYVPCCVSAAGADPVPEHDSHGEFIYLVAETYRHTRDRALAEKMWPVVARVVAYIEATREPSGLMPASISHEGYSAKPMHSYWDDLFVLRGLEDAAFLARELGKPEAARYAKLHDDFHRTLLASIAQTMKEHGIEYIPGSAELGDFDATSTTIAVTPVEADLPREALLRTFDKYFEHALEPRDYTPYELRIVGTLVRLGQPERARQLLDYFFADQRPAAWHQWAEVVRRNPREPGFIGDMPHTWVGSDYIRSVVDMFVYERGDSLVIGAGIDPAWLDQGVRVENISTHFGLVSYTMRREHGKVVVKFQKKPDAKSVMSPQLDR